MKIGQSVITLTMKDTGRSYLFGSLSAIYGMFSNEELGITYSALRNAVGKYTKDRHVDESEPFAQVIYDISSSIISSGSKIFSAAITIQCYIVTMQQR